MKIIDGKQRGVVLLIELFFTLMMWLLFIFLLMLLIPQFSNRLFTVPENTFLMLAFLLTLISLFTVFSSITYWGIYNKKKYGPLKRRTMPKAITTEELADACNIPVEEVHRLQQEKWIDIDRVQE